MPTKKDWSSEDFVTYWKYYTPPARASPSDLEHIRKLILQKAPDAKILILGATPEYRNLCIELNMPVTLFDFSKKNYEYLTQEVKGKPKETFVEGNWVETVIPEKFDIILADNVINIVPKENLKKLLDNISKMLNSEGFFIPRTYIREKNEKYTAEKALEEYRKKWNNFPMYTGLMRNIYMAANNEEIDSLMLKDCWVLLTELYNKKLLTEDEYEECKKYGLEGREFKFFIPIQEYIESELAKIFKIVEIFYATEPYLIDKKWPLYILTSK